MSCDNPEHAALEGELNDALEEALQMEERLAAYEAAGADGGGVGGGADAAAKAVEDLATLTEHAAILEKERDTYEQDYLNKKDRVNELETQLEDKDQQTKELDRLRRKLEEDLENTRKLLQTEKTKAADAQKRAGGADKSRRKEQRDQIKVLQELQDLRERTEDLEAQVKERDIVVEELVLSNQAQLERNETLTVQNEDLRGEFNEATQLLEEKMRELSDCHDQLEVAREAEDEYERRLDEEQANGRRTVHALEDELRADKALVTQLREEAARAKDRAGAGGARERELEQIRAEVERLGRELLGQSMASEQARLDLEVLTNELELERRKNRDQPHEIRAAEAHKAEALEAKVKALNVELDTEKQRYGELEERKGKLETELQESEDWKSRYEEGHGLVDAVRFQKKLKNDLHRLEAELEQRSLKMGEIMDANEVLTLTCQRLKEEAGRPQDFSYVDLAGVKQAQAGEIARLTAVSAELQAQVDDLNDERVRLLKKLRDGAATVALSSTSGGGVEGGAGRERGSISNADGLWSEGDAKLAEAVKRLTLDVNLRDAQIEKLERSLLMLGGEDALFAQAAGEVTPPAGDPADASTGDTKRTSPGSAPPAEGGDISAAEGVDPQSAAVLAREELDRLAQENSSLKEALRAMAAGSDVTKATNASKAGNAGNGLETNSGTGGNGGDENSVVDGNRNASEGAAAGPEDAACRAAELQVSRAEEDREAALQMQKAADERVAQLTRVNETVMRQLQELLVRKDSPREAARRAGRAGALAGAGAAGAKAGENEKDKPAAAVQADMQRLIAEMGDLRQLVAGGFAKNATAVPRHPGTKSSSPRVSTDEGVSRGENEGAAASTTAGGREAMASRIGQRVDGEEAMVGGGGGGGVPAPATGSEEAFSQRKQQQPRTPQTAEGQEALRWHLRRLNLPPEEWADDVRDVNAQLVEALEQLRAREMELDEHEELITRYETHLSDMRAQVAVLYREHAEHEKEWEESRKAFAEEAEGLREEREALSVRARRLEEVLDVEDQAAEDPTAPHRALRELSRKVTVYEVNEAVLARRYASIKEQLQMESEARSAAERDFLEMSTAGKTRLLYLEQWKAGASARLVRLQERLDHSVPGHDLVCARRELEELQGEFLRLLQSSAESRVEVAKLSGLSGRARELEEDVASARVSLAASEEGLKQANLRAEKADKRAETAVSEAGAQVAAAAGGATQADFSNLLAEVAKHQGECARAEVERAAAARRAEIAERRLASHEGELRTVKERAASLEAREREARQHAQTAAAELIKVQNRFEGGLTGEQGRALEEKLERELVRMEALALEAERYKEVADIASEQALAMNNQRKDAEDELSELRKAVSDLESRSDDDRLIGQLQRKLTATKVAYRSFARKHEMTRANLRRKTALLRVLESRLDKREDSLHDLHERSQEKVAALQGALIALSEGRTGSAAGPDGAAGPDHGLTITRGRELAATVSELSAALEAAEAGVRAAEQARRSAEMDAEAAEESRRGLETLVADFKGLVLPSGEGGDDNSDQADASIGADGNDRGTTPAIPSSSSYHSNSSSAQTKLGSDAASVAAAAAREMAARRLLSLSEELRAAKLEASGLRRQVAGLREDRRHLERKLAGADAAARTLEEAKAEAETRALLSGHGGGRGDGERLRVGDGGDGLEFVGGGVGGDSVGAGVRPGRRRGGDGESDSAARLSEEDKGLLVAAAVPAEIDVGGLDPEETLRRLEVAHAKATSLARALEGIKSERDSALAKAEEALRETRDLQRALRFYEKQATQNGFSLIDDSLALPGTDVDGAETALVGVSIGGRGSRGRDRGREQRSVEVERERAGMQEAASTTVASMKRLLEEKNAALERMKRKLDEARAAGRGSSVADRSEAARLTDRIYRENEDSLGQLRMALRQLGAAGGLTGEGIAMNSRLIGQMEEVSGLLGEKDETIRQLEVKLRTACNQRERAEQRCGEALEENAKIRSDLVTLAAQAQDAEERLLAALEDKSGTKRLAELRKALLAKEKKMRTLREALVKLKQEFVQAEVDREAAAIAGEREKARRAEDRSQGVDDRLKRLKEQLVTLQEGMSQAARDLEKERRGRDSATKAKEKVLEDNAQLRAEMTKTEDRAAALEGRLTETRRDLDAAREKEERLRARIKTLSGANNGDNRRGPSETRIGEGKSSSDLDDDSTADATGGRDMDHDAGGGGGGGKRRRVNELEKRVQVLTAQNAALRSIVPPPAPPESAEKKGARSASTMIGQGRRLGSAADAANSEPAKTTTPRAGEPAASAGAGGADGHRETARRAWETDKKLRRRVETLERRLEERGVELRAAEGQTAKAKDQLARANSDKEAAQRKVEEAGRRQDGRGSPGGATEEVRSKVFSLEEENASLRRTAELELPREVDSLKHQVRVLRAQLEETDNQLEEAERRAKAAVARALSGSTEGGGGGGGILRAEEGLFHDLEAARDEVSAQKAARRELEAQVLERDAANMELRFDLEASAAEATRLRRRATELHATLRNHRIASGGSGEKDAASRPAGGRFKRERDLEGVVDALKRVTEKLRSENERLRRAAGDGSGRAEAERSAREAKKRAAALREEVERLAARAKEADGAVQKLAQKQDLINQLRRKLKARDDDLRNFQQRAEDLAETKALLSAELEAANQRLIANGRDDPSEQSTAHSASAIAAAKAETATLRQQVQHQTDTINRLRDANTNREDADGASRGDGTGASERNVSSRGDDGRDDTRYPDANAAALSEAVEAAEEAAEAAQEEAQELRQRLSESERELQRMERRSASGDSGVVGTPYGLARSGAAMLSAPLEEENARLKEENEKLSRELQAFDLDFFEEIEDLKYKYSEAARKLRQYEERSSHR